MFGPDLRIDSRENPLLHNPVCSSPCLCVDDHQFPVHGREMGIKELLDSCSIGLPDDDDRLLHQQTGL